MEELTSEPETNSREYWDQRFRLDWTTTGGPNQTRFFGGLATELMPDGLVEAVRSNSWNVCDWGCADGTATDMLGDLCGRDNVIGVDFSSTAIEQARGRYPDLAFEAVDLLAANTEFTTDVLFSSNTLEHFENPWSVAESLAARTRRALVFLIPFNEAELHPEHFVRITADSVPARIGRFGLGGVAVVDTRAMEYTLWDGEQLFAIYLADEAPASLLFSRSAVATRRPVSRAAFEQEYQRLYDLYFEQVKQLEALEGQRQLEQAMKLEALEGQRQVADELERVKGLHRNLLKRLERLNAESS